MNQMVKIGIVALLVTGTAVGCATPQAVKEASTKAEKLFLQGQMNFERTDYKGAITKYNKVRNEHPYSKYAVLADLRIADAYYEQSQWSSAAEQYRTFVKLHPNHPEVAYARFRVGKALYQKTPDNWFFLPPAYERDLGSTKRAVQGLRKFVENHSDSEYYPEGKKMLRKARRRLADHEMYVADFYLDRENPRGAKMRLQHLLNHYSGLGLDAKALYLLAVTHLKLGDRKKAKLALQDLIEYHPDSKYAGKAKDYMSSHDLSSGS
ncbi:MAG: outer membrane protein assembly factor BamD [Bradymonadaceae bacterium]